MNECLFVCQWVCRVFRDDASLHLTILVHLERENKRFHWVSVNANKIYMKWIYWIYSPLWFSDDNIITTGDHIIFLKIWIECKRHFFFLFKVQCFLPFYFLIALSLPLVLECIYKLILTCFEQLWVHLMWCTNRWTQNIYLSCCIYWEWTSALQYQLIHFSSFK